MVRLKQQTYHAVIKINLLCLAASVAAKMKLSVPVFLILTVFCFQKSYLYLFNLKVIELLYNKMFEFDIDFSEYCSDQTYRIAPPFCIIFVVSFSILLA